MTRVRQRPYLNIHVENWSRGAGARARAWMYKHLNRDVNTAHSGTSIDCTVSPGRGLARFRWSQPMAVHLTRSETV